MILTGAFGLISRSVPESATYLAVYRLQLIGLEPWTK
jgi:hypothetical protein